MVLLPIGDEVARLPQEWFLNTPVLWLGALVLISLCEVLCAMRQRSQKAVEFAVASLIALGLLILLVWDPVFKAAKQSPVSHRTVDSAFGTHPYRLDRFVLLDFSGATETKDGASRRLLAAHVQRPAPQTGRSRFAMCQRSGSPMSAAWKRQRNKSAR